MGRTGDRPESRTFLRIREAAFRQSSAFRRRFSMPGWKPSGAVRTNAAKSFGALSFWTPPAIGDSRDGCADERQSGIGLEARAAKLPLRFAGPRAFTPGRSQAELRRLLTVKRASTEERDFPLGEYRSRIAYEPSRWLAVPNHRQPNARHAKKLS